MKKEEKETIKRLNQLIISLNYRISDLQSEVKYYKKRYLNKKAVVSELIEENITLYTELKELRIEKEEIEEREVDLARKIKIIEDICMTFDVKLFEQIKNVLANDRESDN